MLSSDSKILIIQNIANYGLKFINQKGFIPGGHNGPYKDNETPVRNTAHFLIIFSFIYKKTLEKKYFDAAKICRDFLLSDRSKPMSSIFFMRNKKNKDFSNGLIGQAWVIEALVESYLLFKDKNSLEAAKENFEAHTFNESYGLWHIQNVDGSQSSIDWTFNHQLWFAAIGEELNSHLGLQSINTSLDKFYLRLDKNFNIYNSGLIKHRVFPSNSRIEIFKKFSKNIINKINYLSTGKNSICKENGYHTFNLFAFSIIYKYKKLPFFETKKFKKAIKYMYTENFKDELMSDKSLSDSNILPVIEPFPFNRYSFAYNAPGFEIPFINKSFPIDSKRKNKLDFFWDLQQEITYDSNLNIYSKNTEDSLTLNSRIYELIRSLN